MISQKYETIVGLFVVAALAALLIMVLIIARQEGLWQNYLTYEAVFKNVSGLRVGSEVRLAGVVVGSVTKTAVRADGKILVTFEVLEKYRDQIREDSVATIGMIGLLGERSLDLTAGTPEKPVLPPGGMVAGTEPLDLQELMARAAPSLEAIQKTFDNLAQITADMKNPTGDFMQALANIRETFKEINQGKGTLGLLLTDPELYKHTMATVISAQKLVDSLNNPKGTLGMVVHDPAFRAELQKTVKNFATLSAHLRQGSVPLSEALAKLPAIIEKVQAFLKNLDQAGEGLPDLVDTGQSALSDVDMVAKGAKKLPILRRYISKPKERTIRVEREVR
jgi:phospholipid/cholesterol/gamma-HCH transport system substrate-binding protein|uniref:MCE family protein n=1 Tax=Desulfobacca acetoxidans TaxID=60893 RepID=A0A7V6A2Q6_9BACT